MKWFQHEADDRNKLESKLIRSKFGAEGYGIFQSLKEIVSEFVEQDNVSEWGKVHPLHTIETLADECSVTPERLREFLVFCNEKGIFEQVDNRLFYQDIFKRLDNFATRIKREKKVTTKSVRSKSEVSATYNTIHNNTIHNNTIQKKTKENKNKYTSLDDVLEKDFLEISEYYSVPITFVRSKYEDLQNYCGARGKKYKNYRLALMDWVKRDAIKIIERQNQKKGGIADGRGIV